MTVVRFEIPGIQEFIFRGRTLLDAIGRSWYIERLTSLSFFGEWAGWGPACRVIHGASGTGIVDVPDPREFVGWLSDTIAADTDSLSVVAEPIPDGRPLLEILRETNHQLRLARLTSQVSQAGSPFWGTLACHDTGAPAEGLSRPLDESSPPQPVSSEVERFRSLGRKAHDEYSTMLLGMESGNTLGFSLPTDIDQLGRSAGETSHIAVIVADLNGLGRTLREFSRTLEGLQDDEAVAKWSAVSNAIRDCQREIARAVVKTLAEKVEVTHDDDRVRARLTGVPEHLAIDLVVENGKIGLPVRPWVAAGDDLILVCESRVAFAIADIITEWLDGAPEGSDDPRVILHEHLGAVPSIGVGIAVVTHGYPLAQAHELAAALCTNAKSMWKDTGDRPGRHHLDWHFGPHSWSEVERLRQMDGSGVGPVATGRRLRDEPEGDKWRVLFDDLIRTDRKTGSLRGADAPARLWIKGELRSAVIGGEEQVDRAFATRNARQVVLRRPVFVPATKDPALLQRAIDLLDDHLELSGARS